MRTVDDVFAQMLLDALEDAYDTGFPMANAALPESTIRNGLSIDLPNIQQARSNPARRKPAGSLVGRASDTPSLRAVPQRRCADSAQTAGDGAGWHTCRTRDDRGGDSGRAER
jgi:hypothetical protein